MHVRAALSLCSVLCVLAVPAAFAQPMAPDANCANCADDLGALISNLNPILAGANVDCDDTANGRPNPAHFKGDVTIAGPYTFNKAKVAEKYHGLDPAKFGTTDVQLPTGGVNNVRDMHYTLGEGVVGMRPVPVSDEGEVTAPNGKKVPGYKVMDDLLRKEMGLKAKDPIFSLIAYVHPEEHNGSLGQLAKEMVKPEMGNTHLGAYIGKGETRNSPEDYHNKVWHVAGYPANVQIVSLKGVPQATLNQNGVNALEILNNGVKFPPDYKNDQYKTVNLKETLGFYKGWIEDEARLREDPNWATYCAEHQTIVTNIMLNVPHNEAAFKQIWGPSTGAKLWVKAKAKYKAATGKDMKETSFEPLWKKEGITNPKNETRIGKGLGWAPQTTADLVANFVEVYASFPDVGAPASAAMVLGFKDTVTGRMGISDPDYMKLAVPIIQKMMVAEAMTQKFATPAGVADPIAFEKYAGKKTAELYVALGGKPADFAPGGTVNPQIMGLAKTMMTEVGKNAPQIIATGGVCSYGAWTWMRKAIEPELAAARATAVADPSKVQFYSPPAVTHRIALGMHPHNPNITIREVATAMDESELLLKNPPTTVANP